jgi:hypothetical protein
MMGGDLLVLASKYVALAAEIEDVRRAMLACLTNGAGANPVPPTPAKRPGVKGPSPNHPNIQAAAKAEKAIIDLLRATPGLKTTELAKTTNAKINTTTERLKRLKARHLVTPAEGGGWQASASA